MNKAQAVADLAFQLAGVTTTDRAQQAIRRALRVTGLTYATRIDENDMNNLLQALASEGGMIQDMALQLAMRSDGAGSGETRQSAA